MPITLRRLRPTFRLTNERELLHYVVRTTALCVVAALAVDVVNQVVFFESWAVALRSWAITVGLVVAIAVPVSRTIGKAQVALYRASTIDPLTGLLNRGALLDGVSERSTILALIIVDIDRFKDVNDTHGHWAGDHVLAAIAGVMAQCLGDLGPVGRLGGEEFALLASGVERAVVLEALERFRRTVAGTPVFTNAAPVSVTVSAGMAINGGGQTFEQLFARADRALYRAKAQGRNRIVVAGDDEPDEDGARRHAPA
ncbi:GGDEF domain-containing protein [Lichenihabitans sp. PAMC28606]|uniref:GGDEF domain-containing protein n=1 Tax=Lichenihabitans sp. PAMC28606 TaxID=2880932 RepID=UPI001D0B9A01|nr:GGDEF domain-containing protein [Lichenihabitans sp. PAMC28606]UDL93341.1 GGDEF domain-containing protein [Lichenihabitans sp. PAMC28606]